MACPHEDHRPHPCRDPYCKPRLLRPLTKAISNNRVGITSLSIHKKIRLPEQSDFYLSYADLTTDLENRLGSDAVQTAEFLDSCIVPDRDGTKRIA